jgi:uncharacterized membrane protein YgcG
MTKKKDTQRTVGGDNIQSTLGHHAHNVAVGKDVHQGVGEYTQAQVTEADLDAVRELFAELRRQVEAQAPPEKKASALERVEELEEAVTADEPDLTTAEYVWRWFSKNLPQLAGTVVSVLVDPVLGKVLEAAGELAANELRRRLGGGR